MAVASGVTMLLASAAYRGAPWAGINAMTRALDPHQRPRERFAKGRTVLGLAILVGGLGAMSAIYERALARKPQARGVLTGTLFALSGYALDRWVLPKPLLRDFEHSMGPVGTFAKYAALALAAAAPPR